MAGHQKNKFPLAIYGAYDTFSGYVLYLNVWTTNNDPRVIGKFYLDYIYEKKSEFPFSPEPIIHRINLRDRQGPK